MKKILVPTDFTETSENALDYAAQLAKHFSSQLVLLHVYHLPMVTSEAPMVLPSNEQLEHDARHALAGCQNRLHIKYGYDLKITCHAMSGFAADEIVVYAQEIGADMVVMGMRDAGKFSEVLIGSVTTAVIEKVDMPVMVISHTVKFKPPKLVALAADFHDINEAALAPLKEICHSFGARIEVLHVAPYDMAIPSIEEAGNGVRLNHFLEGTTHSFHTVMNDNVVEGINEFCDDHGTDMVSIISREHSFVDRLVNGSLSKRMSFHSHVPLLALHYKK